MTTSAELLKARKKGALILHRGSEVEYAPQCPWDRTPWLMHGGTRHTAAECYVFFPKESTTVNTEFGPVKVDRDILALWNTYGWPEGRVLKNLADEYAAAHDGR